MSSVSGIIPAAGEGTRLRPLTLAAPKHLISLLGKPMIGYPISHLVEAGVNNITVVVGYLGHLIRDALGDGSRFGARFNYIVQERRLGIAHAVHLAIVEAGITGPFVVYLGDNILKGGIVRYLSRFLEGGYDVYILLARVRDPSRFGVAVIRDGRIVRLVEKPREPISDLAVIGVYFFRDPDLVEEAFSTLKPSRRGEYEITELIQWFIDHGYNVGYETVSGWWKDVGTPQGLLEALYLLLDEVEPRLEGSVEGEVYGRVVVEEGAVVEGTVYGPAYIGRGSHVGPKAKVEHYVSLEPASHVASGTVTRSLLLEESLVDINSLRLVDSVIGRRARITCKRELYGTLQAALSDYSSVEI